MEIRALTPAEQKYTYAQSMQLEGQTSNIGHLRGCLLYTSPSPRDTERSRMPSSA